MYLQKLNLVRRDFDLELNILLHGNGGNVLAVLMDRLDVDWDYCVLLGKNE